jgi:hypothetical protein
MGRSFTIHPKRIIDHKLREGKKDKTQTSNYLFLVAWSGYPNQDTWEPYGNLRKNTVLHEYILNNPSLEPIKKYVKKYIKKLESE